MIYNHFCKHILFTLFTTFVYFFQGNQIVLRPSLQQQQQDKIETLEKEVEDLREKLQAKIEENLNRAAEINTNDFIFENEQIVK